MNFIKLKSFLPIVVLMFSLQLKAQEIIDQVVAVVGDKIVLQSEIEAKYMQYKAQGMTAKKGDLRCKVLEESLVEKLLLNQADLDSIVVSEMEVTGNLEQRINYFIQQFGSHEEMERYYNKKMVEIREEMTDIVRNDLIQQRMKKAVEFLKSSDLHVTQIALAVGYCELSNFTSTFQRTIGIRPSSFRKAIMPKAFSNRHTIN